MVEYTTKTSSGPLSQGRSNDMRNISSINIQNNQCFPEILDFSPFNPPSFFSNRLSNTFSALFLNLLFNALELN